MMKISRTTIHMYPLDTRMHPQMNICMAPYHPETRIVGITSILSTGIRYPVLGRLLIQMRTEPLKTERSIVLPSLSPQMPKLRTATAPLILVLLLQLILLPCLVVVKVGRVLQDLSLRCQAWHHSTMDERLPPTWICGCDKIDVMALTMVSDMSEESKPTVGIEDRMDIDGTQQRKLKCAKGFI